ncbi:MAG: rhomboid family intramembrane serine protease [Nitrososphaerota archaeon]|nr:rhomboid family intramembrane serine protease [Candidatus Bathyarchaeota archaeon]MDW8049018.1 rhomboid family intramembrane serine protease [Nitrososphaerota archaeon]
MFPIRDENRPLSKPLVNYALITANVIVFFYFFLQGQDSMYKAFYVYGAIPAEILRGERVWTILTSMFMHGDISHLLGNMIFLYVFGDNVEDTFGHIKYLAFYIMGGVVASLAHIGSTLLSMYYSAGVYPFFPDLLIPSLGASGAISGVLGAYFLLFPNSRIRTLVWYFYIVTVIKIPAYYYLGFWFVYQLLMGFGALLGMPSTVAFWAHIGGFVYGSALVRLVRIRPKRRPLLVAPETVRPVVAPWVITPLVDLIVEDDRITVLAYMPGVEEEAIRIKASEWEIEISAEYRDIKLYRRVGLPIPVIPKPENLMYRNGVLSFTLNRLHG